MPKQKKNTPKGIGARKPLSDRELKRRKKAVSVAIYNNYLASQQAKAAEVAAREQSAEEFSVVHNVDTGLDDAGVELDFQFLSIPATFQKVQGNINLRDTQLYFNDVLVLPFTAIKAQFVNVVKEGGKIILKLELFDTTKVHFLFSCLHDRDVVKNYISSKSINEENEIQSDSGFQETYFDSGCQET